MDAALVGLDITLGIVCVDRNVFFLGTSEACFLCFTFPPASVTGGFSCYTLCLDTFISADTLVARESQSLF